MNKDSHETTHPVRVAAIYDVHGNMPALEAVLKEVRAAGVDRVVVGGDVVPGPMPGEALRALLALDIPTDFIYGNGERAVLASLSGNESTTLPEAVRHAIRWSGEQLSADERRLVEGWPATVRLNVLGLGDTLFCHATPRDENEIFTVATPAEVLAPLFDSTGANAVVCGHTHMQFDRRVGEVRVVNAGSVGMPFGTPGAHWALFGPEVALRQTNYDLEDAAAKVRSTDYPGADSLAENNILRVPSEQDMLDVFERVAIKANPS